jgi:hypothetical protein
MCRPLWSGTIGASAEASPAVNNGVVYVAGSKRLFAFSAAGCGQSVCAPLWRTTQLAGVEAFQGSGPAVSGGRVFIASSDTSVSIGRVYAFTAAGCGQFTCAPQWRGQINGGGFEVTPSVANGVVYAGSTDGLFAFRATGCGTATCAPLWRGSPVSGVFAGTQASPVIAGGVVYSAQNNQRVGGYPAAGCGATSCQPLWFFITQGSIVNTPVIVNGRLYISGSNFGITPEIYVFHLV